MGWALGVERLDELAERVARLLDLRMPGTFMERLKKLGTLFDGIARHTEEGYAFQRTAAEEGFRSAVRERDEPFGDSAFR